MDRLERYASKISNWFWLKRWGDRSLYRRSQKKGTPTNDGMPVLPGGSLLI